MKNLFMYSNTCKPLNTDTLDVLKEFACHLYGHVKQNYIREVIRFHFEGKSKRAWYTVKLYKSPSEPFRGFQPSYCNVV